jgi:hypothetical protein
MLKNVLPKVLFVAGIVAIIAAGNYYFPEAPGTVQAKEAQQHTQEQSDEQSE